MHDCVAHVKDALSKVEGVSDVVVSLDEKAAHIKLYRECHRSDVD